MPGLNFLMRGSGLHWPYQIFGADDGVEVIVDTKTFFDAFDVDSRATPSVGHSQYSVDQLCCWHCADHMSKTNNSFSLLTPIRVHQQSESLVEVYEVSTDINKRQDASKSQGSACTVICIPADYSVGVMWIDFELLIRLLKPISVLLLF